MQSKGLDFLRPIWVVIYSGVDFYTGSQVISGLNLSESDVSVTYTRYVNNYKMATQRNDKTIDEAVRDGLTPGKKF